MTPVADADAAPLDLRLVPAALTGWAVTGAGILWPVGGSAVAAVATVAATAALGWWGSGRRVATDGKGVGASVLAVGLVAAGFAIAIGLRVDEVREHPVAERYGTAAAVIVTPTESPRALGGNRTMFRGSLMNLDGREISGRVVVFASTSRLGELTAGTPVAFRARIGRPTRRDLSVAVLSAIGDPTFGEASAVQRAAADVRAGFAEAARRSLPADQAAMLPALVLGDTSGVPRQTTADFRAAGLTQVSVR
ncbi:hypothetical protein ABQF33_03040 [Mycolicibacterium sp. XJ2]